MLRQIVDQGLRPLRREPGQRSHLLQRRRLHNAADAVAHTDVALHRPLDIRLRQALIDRAALLGHAIGDGIHIRGGAAHIQRHQLADARLALAALCQQLHGTHHGGRRRHQDAGNELGRMGKALCLNDPVQKQRANTFLGRLDVEHAELRHDIFTYPHAASG